MASALAGCGKESSIAKDEKIVTTIHAEYPSYDSAQNLIDKADLVFSGTVQMGK